MASTIDKYIIDVAVVGENAVRGLDKSINSLAGRIAQLGAGVFIANAYRMADAMKDLADATGLSTGYIDTFSKGLQDAGGEIKNADKILTTFYRTLEDMSSGSDDAERSFKKLGVTFKDLRELSERDILEKTLASLAKMEKGAARTSAGIAIFGKSFALINPETLRRALDTNNVEAFTASINKAAEIVGAMETNYRNLQNTALYTLNVLVGSTDKLFLSGEKVATILKVIAALFAISFGLTVIRSVASLVTVITTLSTAIRGATIGMAGFVAITGGVAGAAAAIASIYTVLKVVNSAIDDATARMNGFNVASSNLDGVPMDSIQNYSNGIKNLNQQLKEGTITQEEFNRKAAELADRVQIDKVTGRPGAFPLASNLTGQQVEAQSRAALLARQQTSELRQQFELQVRYERSLLETIGIDEDRAIMLRELAKIQLDYDTKRIEYQSKILEEQSRGEETNQAIIQQLKIQLADLDSQQAITEQLAKDENNRSIFVKGNTVELQKQLSIIQTIMDQQFNLVELERLRSIATGELSEEEADYQAERQRIAIDGAAKIIAIEEQIAAEVNDIKRRQLENDLEIEKQRLQNALDNLDKRVEAERETELSSKAKTRSIFEDIAKSTTPAMVAADSLRQAFQSVDDALTEFVTKGKFNFKEFTRSLLADIALIIARALVMRAILAIVGIINPGAGAALQTAMAFGGGRAKGGPVLPGRAYLVGEKGPELAMFDRPGNIIPNNQLAMAGGGSTNVTYNINAVDASSFRSLVARDPQFIYNVTEVGRRSNPARRLA